VIVLAETEKAWRVKWGDDEDERAWVPKSQCEIEGKAYTGRVVTLTLPVSLAQDKGMI
jgi:hypothetical protein